ncbi:hypothetical protein CCP3SC1AL1_1080002 [Gammaproteobacteria bacterium]
MALKSFASIRTESWLVVLLVLLFQSCLFSLAYGEDDNNKQGGDNSQQSYFDKIKGVANAAAILAKDKVGAAASLVKDKAGAAASLAKDKAGAAASGIAAIVKSDNHRFTVGRRQHFGSDFTADAWILSPVHTRITSGPTARSRCSRYTRNLRPL